MAAAYGAIANGGVYVKPIGILKIEDRNGKVIFENKTERREAVDPRAAYLTVDMMKGVFVNARQQAQALAARQLAKPVQPTTLKTHGL